MLGDQLVIFINADLVDIAFHYDRAMGIAHGHGVIVTVKANQGERCTSSDHSGRFAIGIRLQDRLPFPG